MPERADTAVQELQAQLAQALAALEKTSTDLGSAHRGMAAADSRQAELGDQLIQTAGEPDQARADAARLVTRTVVLGE